MSDANKALAEVRGWLCDNLGSGDAGKVCGMLSVVSRRINELLDENAELREQGELLFDKTLELAGENAKLRELVKDMWRDIPKSESCGWDIDANCCTGCDKCGGECSYWYRMRELGVEVDG